MKKSIKISRGKNGWGGPLVISADEKKNKVLAVTGGGIEEVAKKIGELLGVEVVDGFKAGVPDEEVIVAVVDCGGTARAGVYPKKGIFTVNLTPVGQSGPLAKFITEDLYVSDVKVENIELLEGEVEEISASETSTAKISSDAKKTTTESNKSIAQLKAEAKEKVADVQVASTKFALLTKIGKGVGGVVNKLYQAARDTIDIVIRNVIPFMAFVSLLIGIIDKSGIGTVIANSVLPLATSLPGMLVISVVCAIPILSPLLGPGAVIAQIVGVLIGVEIGKGNIPPQYALPALFAINPQVGADFIPVGLALGEAESETIEVGVPAILFSRLITGPISVLIAYAASIGLYS